MKKLYYLYMTWASNSSFPGVSWLDFSSINLNCNVLDKARMGYMNQAAVDRFFLASCEGNMSSCYRYQFLEAITRVANAKFKELGHAKTTALAVEKLLNEHYFALGPIDEHEGYRKTVLWNNEVSDILLANETGLMKIYNSFCRMGKKFPTKSDMIYLMTK